LKQRLLSFLGALVIRALHATLRVRHIHVENILGVPEYIIAFWHDHLLLMLHSRFRRPITVMSSQSRDGDIAVGIYAHYGVATSRGSSTRGGLAGLRGLIRSARSGSNVVFTPDGPRGPAKVAQPGAVWLAKATGNPIVPFHIESSRHWTLNSWDRTQIPRPFADVAIAIGDPIEVPPDADDAAMEQTRLLLEARLKALEAHALAMLTAG